MPKKVIHTDDLPKWGVSKQKLPHSYLDHLTEAVHPSPDGKGMISLEEIMIRQHFEAAIDGSMKAMTWLLKKIVDENAAELAACRMHPFVNINCEHYCQPLGPALAALGCASVIQSTAGVHERPRIAFAPWFVEAIERRCPAERVEPVKAWLEAGGKQLPRNPEPDRCD